MKRHINYYFLGVSFLLSFSGLMFLAVVSAPTSLQLFDNANHYFYHQLFAVLLGVVIGFIAYKTPLDFIKKAAPWLLLANLMVLSVVLLPFIGLKFWGAKRWISVGGGTVQPSEFLKITAILYLSAWLSNKFSGTNKKNWGALAKKTYENFVYVFIPFFILLSFIALVLILQPDMSTLGIIALTLIAVYFAAGTPLWHSLLIIILGGSASALLVKLEPYRFQRFLIFLNPNKDPLGTGMQLKQSIIALGSGGWFGKGIGMSTQQFILPQAMADSIFAILGEEAGVIGCTILVLVFLFFLWQGIKIATSANDKFSKLTAIGITTWILLQAFINIASTIGIFPLSGIPLPFFSYGGSHIVSELIGVGILLNISKHA